MKKFKRKNTNSIVNTLTDAQKFIFAPIAFQALSSMLDFGIIDYLDKNSASEDEIISSLSLDEYTVRTLLQVAMANNIVELADNKFSLTKFGKLFLYDEMTKVNFNFVKEVYYLGASELFNSFKEGKPKGLHKFYVDYPTIYPALTSLPDKFMQSWYQFDHFYSDNSFEEVFKIISNKYNSIYDIGGNTGKFEKLCLSHNSDINITMLDLPSNVDKIKDNYDLKNCKFHPIDVLSDKPKYPDIKNSAILMSQFLDCFSKKDIAKILTDLSRSMDKNSSLYILEPYTDMQKYRGAEYTLLHASLYFTCMANGVSKFYTIDEMKELLSQAGFNIKKQYDDIGSFNYTLLECGKNALVSD